MSVVHGAPAHRATRPTLAKCESFRPCPVDGGLAFASLSAGFGHTCGITTKGETWCWGDGRDGALGDGGTAIARTPVRVRNVPRLVEVQAGGDYTCGRTEDGAVYCWGKSYPVPGQPKPVSVPARVMFDEPVIALTAGWRHACAIGEARNAYCWGFNADGEAGHGTSGIAASVIPLPARVLGDLKWNALSAGLDFTCGLTTSGVAYCWGSNLNRVLGPAAPARCGDVEPVPCAAEPVRINTTEVFAELSAGASHVCARTFESEIYCWGSNVQGQSGAPGVGSGRTVYAPRRVPPPARVREFSAVAAGGSHTCALALSGELYCWGLNASGELGWRSDTPSTSPTFVQAAPRLVAVRAGEYHTCGTTQRKRAYCWGNNSLGALGRR